MSKVRWTEGHLLRLFPSRRSVNLARFSTSTTMTELGGPQVPRPQASGVSARFRVSYWDNWVGQLFQRVFNLCSAVSRWKGFSMRALVTACRTWGSVRHEAERAESSSVRGGCQCARYRVHDRPAQPVPSSIEKVGTVSAPKLRAYYDISSSVTWVHRPGRPVWQTDTPSASPIGQRRESESSVLVTQRIEAHRIAVMTTWFRFSLHNLGPSGLSRWQTRLWFTCKNYRRPALGGQWKPRCGQFHW